MNWANVQLAQRRLRLSIAQARARERPRPAWSNGKPRPLRAVAGASIAPPPNLREIIEIVPSERLTASNCHRSDRDDGFDLDHGEAVRLCRFAASLSLVHAENALNASSLTCSLGVASGCSAFAIRLLALKVRPPRAARIFP